MILALTFTFHIVKDSTGIFGLHEYKIQNPSPIRAVI